MMFNKNPGQKQLQDFAARSRQNADRNRQTGAIVEHLRREELRRQQAQAKSTGLKPAARQSRAEQAIDPFSIVEAEAARLSRLEEAGRLSMEDFQRKLYDMGVRDQQGHLWVLGAALGEWYRIEGKNVIPGIPPRSQARERQEPWYEKDLPIPYPAETGGEGNKFLGFLAFIVLGAISGWVLLLVASSMVGANDMWLVFCPLWLTSLGIAFLIARKIWRG